MITRLQLLKRANKKSNKKIKDFVKSENISKMIIKGISFKKINIKETIFAKHRVYLSDCLIIGNLMNSRPILYCFNYTKIGNMTNVSIISKKIKGK